MNILGREKQEAAIAALVEGASIRLIPESRGDVLSLLGYQSF